MADFEEKIEKLPQWEVIGGVALVGGLILYLYAKHSKAAAASASIPLAGGNTPTTSQEQTAATAATSDANASMTQQLTALGSFFGTGLTNSTNAINSAITGSNTSTAAAISASQSALGSQMTGSQTATLAAIQQANTQMTQQLQAFSSLFTAQEQQQYHVMGMQSAAACVGGTRNGKPNVFQYCTNGQAAMELNQAGVDPNNTTAVTTYVQSKYQSCQSGAGYDPVCVGKLIAAGNNSGG